MDDLVKKHAALRQSLKNPSTIDVDDLTNQLGSQPLSQIELTMLNIIKNLNERVTRLENKTTNI